MREVSPGLFVGDDADAAAVGAGDGWFVIHAAKEPYHRAAVGYRSLGAPRGHPEYLFAYREGELCLNLVDVPDPAYVPHAVMTEAIATIARELAAGKKVLVHCNQGKSRSPMIAMLWMCLHTDVFDDCDYDAAAAAFTKIYPAFAPAGGMAGYARALFAGTAGPSQVIETPAQPVPKGVPARPPSEATRPDSRVLFNL